MAKSFEAQVSNSADEESPKRQGLSTRPTSGIVKSLKEETAEYQLAKWIEQKQDN